MYQKFHPNTQDNVKASTKATRKFYMLGLWFGVQCWSEEIPLSDWKKDT